VVGRRARRTLSEFGIEVLAGPANVGGKNLTGLFVDISLIGLDTCRHTRAGWLNNYLQMDFWQRKWLPGRSIRRGRRVSEVLGRRRFWLLHS
jgi:hypothetical protein